MISQRERARRNLLIIAINTALDRKIFSLDPSAIQLPDRGATIHFTVFGKQVAAHFRDAGFDEIKVNAIFDPTSLGYRLITSGLFYSFPVGDAAAESWLERREGKYLQSSTLFRCSHKAKASLATLSVSPAGYLDRGRLRL